MGPSRGNVPSPRIAHLWEAKLQRKDWITGLILFSVVSSLWGCATRRDVAILDRETYRLQSQIASQQKEKDSYQQEIEKLQKDIKALQKETNGIKTEVMGEAKKGQADLSLRLENLQTEVRTLATSFEEYRDLFKKPSKEMDRLKENIVLRTTALEDKEKLLEERDQKLEERMKGVEEHLKGLEGKIGQLASKLSEFEGLVRSRGEASVEGKEGSARVGDLYKDAYETLQKGNYEGARRKFETFLKQYPNTELSDNAQFWIGETYYARKDYEKAILEYEKAIAKYPEGDKVPSALFKQGLAFLELGDKTNGRNLLKRVIERYPNSEQADMAKKRLDSIK
jgi:tol-pal system protein YbgF